VTTRYIARADSSQNRQFKRSKAGLFDPSAAGFENSSGLVRKPQSKAPRLFWGNKSIASELLRICLARRECGASMCEKCVEIDATIARYRRIQRSIGDQVTADRTKELIADLHAPKGRLHPDETK
jgi:hypothetical protein